VFWIEHIWVSEAVASRNAPVRGNLQHSKVGRVAYEPQRFIKTGMSYFPIGWLKPEMGYEI
jgi:hypothetical protein